MILKFRTGLTNWKLIEGFKEIEYFHVDQITGGTENGEAPYYYIAGKPDERFWPSIIYPIHLANVGPTKDIGIIANNDAVFDSNPYLILLLGVDDVFILNEEGKTVDRIY